MVHSMVGLQSAIELWPGVGVAVSDDAQSCVTGLAGAYRRWQIVVTGSTPSARGVCPVYSSATEHNG